MVSELTTLLDEETPEKEPERNKGFWIRIKDYIFGEDEQLGNPFVPGFNVREEFAVWVREEFPDLKSYRYNFNMKKVEGFDQRRKEVYKAAILTCNHGIKTTGTCVRRWFKERKRNLRASYGMEETRYAYAVNELVELIERVSPNLSGNTYNSYPARRKK